MEKPTELIEVVARALPGFASDIADAAGLTTSAVCRNLRKLEVQDRAHIDKYPEKGVRRGARWAAGPKPADAPAPPPKQPKNQAARERKTRPPKNTWENYRNTKNEDATIERAKSSPANWLSSLDAA